MSFFMSKLRDQILERKGKAEDFLRTKRLMWGDLERLFHNKLTDSVSANAKSQVFDPKLTTLTLERGYRVMAQLPTGKVKPISANDIGTTKLMNLVLDKYVVPNANAQFDFLTKLRMTDIYSNVYGNFFAMVDWDIKKNGYVGPDMWLLNIRDVFPQVGAMSIEDSDYVIVRTWKSLSYFEGLNKQQGFKNLPQIIAKLKEVSGSKQRRDTSSTSKREEDQYPTAVSAKQAGYFEVLTQFEKDRWVDFCVDADLEFRDQKNPHENDELPVVCKYSIPLLDDFMGMGDFERGKTMQMTINSIWNLYLDATKMSIFPPALINKDFIASMSSIKWGAAEKWLVRGASTANAAQILNLTPQGVSTFSSTYQVASSALLNMFGTTDTAATAQTEAGFGKTPQALKMQTQRENTRDNADRFCMEQFLAKVMKKMVNLVSKKQSGSVNLRLFGKELEQLQRSYPELKEAYDEKTGRLSLKKGNSTLYDYEMVSGSTYAVDQQSQQANLAALIDMVIKNPQIIQVLDQEGYTLKFGELFKRTISNSGIQDWDKILEEKNEDEQDTSILQQDAQQFMQAVQQSQGDLNQIPPQPQGQEMAPGGLQGMQQPGGLG